MEEKIELFFCSGSRRYFLHNTHKTSMNPLTLDTIGLDSLKILD